jgi:hypothetical protein
MEVLRYSTVLLNSDCYPGVGVETNYDILCIHLANKTFFPAKIISQEFCSCKI